MSEFITRILKMCLRYELENNPHGSLTQFELVKAEGIQDVIKIKYNTSWFILILGLVLLSVASIL